MLLVYLHHQHQVQLDTAQRQLRQLNHQMIPLKIYFYHMDFLKHCKFTSRESVEVFVNVYNHT
jgi:hypothetical protein